MSKILIIGQAPPLKKQAIPYDTTLLYIILENVGVSKEQAQDMFEFEALTDKFPGLTKTNGHKAPSKVDMDDYWQRVLLAKVGKAEKIILLGKPAQKYFMAKRKTVNPKILVLALDHPSRRNYNRIMFNIKEITKSLNTFLNISSV